MIPDESTAADVSRHADMFAALGSEPRLRVLRLLLSAHPDGLVVGEIRRMLGILPSTLSHHLERLRQAGLVTVKRERTFLRHAANTIALQELLSFLVSECFTRSGAICPDVVVGICRSS